MNFGFYVSNKATRLKKTIACLKDKKECVDLLRDIVFVYRDSEYCDGLSMMCQESKIAFCQRAIVRVKKEDRSTVVSSDLFSLMLQYKADYLFVFGASILRGELLDKYSNRIINFHPSLLPAFPGKKSIDQALDYGSFLVGNTAHFINEKIDAGPILMHNIFITNGTIDYDKVLDNQIFMLIQILLWLKQGRVKINGRRVTVENANYGLSAFIPNIEEELLRNMIKYAIDNNGQNI